MSSDPRSSFDPDSGSNLDRVRACYEALNSGDAARVASHFTADATHYYTRLEPHRGAETIGQATEWAVAYIGAHWTVENAIEEGDQAVIEWTMTWRHAESGEPRLDRGTERFLFRDGRIAEIRAYYHSGPKNRQGNLLGFDHAGRGHMTLPAGRKANSELANQPAGSRRAVSRPARGRPAAG